jgi:hypothetical protein
MSLQCSSLDTVRFWPIFAAQCTATVDQKQSLDH